MKKAETLPVGTIAQDEAGVEARGCGGDPLRVTADGEKQRGQEMQI